FTVIPRRGLLWKVHLKRSKSKRDTWTEPLVRVVRKDYTLRTLHTTPAEEAFDQIERLGFPLCSPFEWRETPPVNALMAKDLPEYLGREVTIYGYMVTVKVTKTSNGKRMNFGNFLDRDGYFFDTVHFPQTAERYPFRGRGVYIVTGKVTEEFGCYNIEVISMEKAALIPDPRYSDLRTTSKFRSLKSVEEGALKREEERKKEVALRGNKTAQSGKSKA